MIDSDSRQNAEPSRASDAIEAVALEALGPGTLSKRYSGPSDAGTTDDGQFYFVTEHIEGQRIDEYCDDRRLDVPARLKLFGQACRAVHFAHQHAVIHHNLKPGNILVTSDGVPKLINFGIAMLVQDGQETTTDSELEEPATLTRTGQLVQTPGFASPEQVKGEPITTASDIYSLGVILYVLLTGRGPYQLKTGSTSEIFQAICEQVPEKPSTSVMRPTGNWMGSTDPVLAAAACPSESSPDIHVPSATTSLQPTTALVAAARGYSPERLKRVLRGDLDAIILMAMRKEPERRYASAEQFADDLERYHHGLPVRAHLNSAMYRITKFVHRHARTVIVSVVLVSAFLAGVMGITMALILARRDRDRAETSFLQARQTVNQFVSRVSEEKLLNQPGLHPLRKALLEEGLRFYEAFLKQRSGDPSLVAELAEARTHVARISSVIGSTNETIGQFQQAVALWEGLVTAQPANPIYREELARALNEQGTVVMRLNGRRDEALRIFHRAQEMIEPIFADSASARAAHELSLILQNIGEIQRQQGLPDDAIKNIRRSLAIESKAVAEDPDSLDVSISMAKAHALLGQTLAEQSDGLEPALVDYQEAVSLLEKVTRKHPEWPDQAISLATFLGDLNRLQQMAGKLDSALVSVQKAVKILETIDRQYPGVLDYQGGLASTYNMMSDLHRHRQEPDEAIAFAQKAQTLLERLMSLHPEDVASRIELAKSQNNLGRLLQQTGEPVEALRSFQRAIDLYEGVPELDPHDSYNLACNIALSIPLIGVKNGSTDTIDSSKLSKNDQLRRGRYGDRAVDVLHRAMIGGILNLDILQSDTDLNPIRDRPDFQDLIKEAEKKMADGKK